MAAQSSSAKPLEFTVVGGYQFASPYEVASEDPFVLAQAGQLAGAWHRDFGDGTAGNTHINGATANRVLGDGTAELFGTMRIDMNEVDASPPGTNALYLAYRSTRFVAAPGRVEIAVVGEFVGGTGRYAGATGHLAATSVNGYFDDGRGTLYLAAAAPEPDEATVRAWTEDYFRATQSGDAERWAATFADYVVLDDPYGAPAPQSRAEIVERGEGFMEAFAEIGLYPDYIFVDGLTATSKWTARGKTPDGEDVRFEGINVTRYNRAGEIVEHTGYWRP